MSKKSVIFSGVSVIMLVPRSALAHFVPPTPFTRVGMTFGIICYLIYIILLVGKDDLSKGKKVFYVLFAIPAVIILSFIADIVTAIFQ
ncbi:MAG: hypothetical protein D3925_13945 [Candidatus Electrothrix sp. AR5]|nr:hypothetical protein [Candidatus Electrothrix sp. AR5]